MTDFIPYPIFHDDVPVDISYIFEGEKPAGKHGFLRAEGRRFVFEDGTVAKFFGTNFNGAGCFPEKDYAKKLARRLSKIGINIVRLHQLDSEWHTPNIFRFTKGKRVTDAALDPESMDRLDYLLYCLKEEGIYIYMDMFTYRKFRSDEGVESAHKLRDAAKPYCVFSRKLIELQKDLCGRLWTHKNPYTGLRYCDEPQIVLAEITNECELFLNFPKRENMVEPYGTEFDGYFAEWLKEKGIDRVPADFDYSSHDDRDLIDFKVDLQNKYYAEMKAAMRAAGVKIPIAGTNWDVTPGNYRTQVTCDFLDTHRYLHMCKWDEFERRCKNESATHRRDAFMASCAYISSDKHPTYISEWDVPWPNEYRAEAVLHAAALASFQGWSGMAIHTYSYSAKLDHVDRIGYEVTAPKIGGIPYRQGVFTAWNDPARFGLFYHAALITRRGDVKEGEEAYAIEHEGYGTWDIERIGRHFERHKLINTLSGAEGLKALDEPGELGVYSSDSGELFRDSVKNYGTIDTDMTKCVYGSLAKNGEIKLRGARVTCKTDFAVIAMSSLTEKGICESDNILLTTVGRAQNTNQHSIGDLLIDVGDAPIVVEPIRADIEIETKESDLSVWAISAEGYYIGTVPTTYADGKLRFTVGDTSRSMYYLIVKS